MRWQTNVQGGIVVLIDSQDYIRYFLYREQGYHAIGPIGTTLPVADRFAGYNKRIAMRECQRDLRRLGYA